MDSITLYFREGSSDKLYQASIQSEGSGYMVHFAYGRRGSTLNTGTKTQAPVDYQTAKNIFEKLVHEKTAKGYKTGDDSTRYQPVAKTARATDIHCQLLNPVIEERVEELILDHEHWMQEKMDGRRLLIRKAGNSITGINRLGLLAAMPEPLIKDAAASDEDFLIDGEAVGDTFYAFDILFLGNEDLRGRRYAERLALLMNLLAAFQHPHLQMVDTLFTAAEKKAHFQLLQKRHAEGVVFKHRDSAYQAGRPHSGGTQLKHKFHETASFIVTKPNDKRSVSLMLWENGKVRPSGNVTIPPNHEIPKPGEIVECRYLYAFKESGSIYQPVFLGRREDIFHEECTTSQLKYKVEPMKLAA
jgi:bifunctional non-homologous end joining protein LigD